MHNFLIIFLITYLAVVYCFKNNNRLRKDTERVNQIRFFNNTSNRKLSNIGNSLTVIDDVGSINYPSPNNFNIRFDNGNYAIIYQKGDEIIYHNFDNDAHNSNNGKKLLDINFDFNWNYNDLSKSFSLIDVNNIDNDRFYIRVLTSQGNQYKFYSIKFNTDGEVIGEIQYISDLCNKIDMYYTTSILNNDNFISIMRCNRISLNGWEIYSLSFNSNGEVYGDFSDNIIVSNGWPSGGIDIWEHDSVALSNGGYVISSFSKSIKWNAIKVYDENESNVKIIRFYQTSTTNVDLIHVSSYDCGFILILTDITDKYSVSWMNYDNYGNQIGEKELLSDELSCGNDNIYSKIVKRDKTFYLTCDGSSGSYSITLNSEEYMIKFINSDKKHMFSDFNYVNDITFYSWKKNNDIYLERYDTSNIESISRLVSPTTGSVSYIAPIQSPSITTSHPTLAPTHCPLVVSDTNYPTLAPTYGYLDSENVDLPNNDNDEANEDGKSPGENPDQDQDNTDKDKSNVEGLTIGLSVSLVIVFILLATTTYCYLNKGFEFIFMREVKTKLKWSCGKGNNSLSKEVKIEEVMVQYESDDDYERGEA